MQAASQREETEWRGQFKREWILAYKGELGKKAKLI